MATRLVAEIERPVGMFGSGRDKDCAVRVLDEADRGPDGVARKPAACLEQRDLAPSGELLADLISGAGQREAPRCQDLPSTPTAGA